MKSLSTLVLLLLLVGLNSFGAADNVPQKANESAKHLVNINTAGIGELDTLPRIGEKIAARIIDYRKTNGSFKRAEDLMKVKGIGPKIFQKLQGLITV